MDSNHHLRSIYRSLIAQKLEGISDGQIAAHFHLMPVGYFIDTPQAGIIQHLMMINEFRKTLEGSDSTTLLLPIVEWKHLHEKALTEVTIVSLDKVGLFYKLAGAFSLAGFNILGANAISRSDQIAIDTFYVSEAEGGIVRNEKNKDLFYQLIDEVLVLNSDLSGRLKAISSGSSAVQHKELEIKKIAVDPHHNTVEIYQEISHRSTKIEIHAPDKLGMLFFLAKTISEHGYDIIFARIHTEHGIAKDTFHIISQSGQTGNDRLLELRSALTRAISNTEAEATYAAGAV